MVRNEAQERARMRAGRKEITAVSHFEKARKKKQDCNSRKNNAAAPFKWHRKFSFFLSILSHDCVSLKEAFNRFIMGGKSNVGKKGNVQFKNRARTHGLCRNLKNIRADAKGTSFSTMIARFEEERIVSKNMTLTLPLSLLDSRFLISNKSDLRYEGLRQSHQYIFSPA